MSCRTSPDIKTNEQNSDGTGLTAQVLKWPGGKSWAADQLAQLAKAELGESGCYKEPFLGGGATFFTLKPVQATLSDANPNLIDFFEVLRSDPEGLLNAVWRLSNTREMYYRVRGSKPKSRLGRAARFLYLNRTCWGGIYRENKSGEFNVPFGNSGRVICRKKTLFEAASILEKAALRCCDFETTLDQANLGDVVYLDPPYSAGFGKECFSRYTANGFGWQDHIRLTSAARRAAERGAFVMVSGAMHLELLNGFRGWWLMPLTRHSMVSRTRESRFKVNEALILSKVPKFGHALVQLLQ